MCNLAGYSGKKSANIDKLKLLAIYGRSRGTDGFGCWMGNALYKYGGWNSEGDSLNVLKGVSITISNKGSRTVVMHNRARSVGYTNVENAHPYRYDYIENKKYIFAHNGTIKNIDTLCQKYNIKQDAGVTDSYYLGKIIYEHGFDVLREYEGFAALTILDTVNDILYIFKGFSQCERAIPSEERPLHWVFFKNAMYYASEEDSLATAMNTSKDIQPVPENTLFAIKDGVIVDSKVYDRSHIQFPTFVNKVYDMFPDNYRNKSKHYGSTNNIKTLYNREPNPQNHSKGSIYFYEGKYWKNGHILTGVYDIRTDLTPVMLTKYDLKEWHEGNSKYDNVKYFYRGFMIKDEHTYFKLIKEGKTDLEYVTYDFVQMLHKDTLYIRLMQNRYTFYYDGTFVENEYKIPLYSIYKYKLDKGYIIWDYVTKNEPIELPGSMEEAYAEYYGGAFS